ncbi:MAG: outer membrane protein assembly factor BamC [Gammaproteobacteria bacterium]|nr:outer membrane protein assembly factor BamC [Gammaproteobacteria bacterium]MBT4491868.1 outer membrane protein assembly factor BamC [Gammaproteobacteria bacterium]
MVLTVTLSLIGGCSWIGLDRYFGISEEQKRLESGSSAPTEVPEDLDEPEFVDLMPIPDVVDYRGLSGQTIEVGLPQALSTRFGVEQIVIRRLGDDRWVFLDLPTATIWPQVVLFWEENHLPVAKLDPRIGVLESEWLVGSTGNPDEIYESLISGSAWSDRDSAQQFKFRVRVEPGVRNGSTELFVEQKQRALGDELEVSWDGSSDNQELEGKLLSTIAYYLGDRVAEGPKVSLLAAGLQESKASLVTESDGMMLSYKLDFNRAWATVGSALEDARVTVDDLDRTNSIYYVTYSSGHDPDPGFFSRLLGRNGGDKDAPADGKRLRVYLKDAGAEVLVTIAMEDDQLDDTTENLILRERLLKLIKEYST